MKKEIDNNYRKESFCAKCSLQFGKPSLLELHESIVHVKEKSPASVANSEVKLKKNLFECQNCCKNFTTKGSLDRHISAVHEGREMSFECEKCQKGYTTKCSLDRHVSSIHEGSKPFECDLCEANFSSKKELTRHKENNHEQKKPFKCIICDAAFSDKATLNGHVMAVHEKKSHLVVNCVTSARLKIQT